MHDAQSTLMEKNLIKGIDVTIHEITPQHKIPV